MNTAPKIISLAEEPKANIMKYREATEVRVEVIMPGNSGCNNAEFFMEAFEPESSKGIFFNPTDASYPLLHDRFHAVRTDAAGQQIAKWRKARQLKPLHLKLPDLKFFGAGGDHEGIGKRLVEASEAKFREIIKRADLPIGWGAGGGGTGTAVLRKVAELCREEGKMPFFILITPDDRLGDKLEIADALHQEIREVGPTFVVRNGKFPVEMRDIPTRNMFRQINVSCRNIFRLIHQSTQVVGLTDIDHNDTHRFAGFGQGRNLNKDGYVGICDILRKIGGESGAATQFGTPDLEKIVDQLMSDTLQPEGMQAMSLQYYFVGAAWRNKQMDEIIDGVKDKTNFPRKGGLVKVQLNDMVEDEMWCGVVALGEFAEMKRNVNSRRSSPQDTPANSLDLSIDVFTSEAGADTSEATVSDEVPPAAQPAAESIVESPAPLTREGLIEKYGELKNAHIWVGGKMKQPPPDVPVGLTEVWRKMAKIDKPTPEHYALVQQHADEIAVFLKPGEKPDIPEQYLKYERETGESARNQVKTTMGMKVKGYLNNLRPNFQRSRA